MTCRNSNRILDLENLVKWQENNGRIKLLVLGPNVENVEAFMSQRIVLHMVKCAENAKKSIIGQSAVKPNLFKKQQLQMNT